MVYRYQNLVKPLGDRRKCCIAKYNNIKNIVTSKFKEKMWCEKELEAKIKLRYYKEVINPTLEEQKYLSILTSSKKKINIAKLRTNSHELHSETGRWTVPKTPWVERICHLCENKNMGGKNLPSL